MLKRTSPSNKNRATFDLPARAAGVAGGFFAAEHGQGWVAAQTTRAHRKLFNQSALLRKYMRACLPQSREMSTRKPVTDLHCGNLPVAVPTV
jgi:hypothetical protein